MKSVSVFGMGYVGAVTAACMAKAGNRVVGVDLNPQKIAMLRSGRAPVLEPGLDELIAEACKASRLVAFHTADVAVRLSDLSFICVGTPSLPNGRPDMRGLARCCHELGQALREKKEFHWIVVRSTVLPGTSQSLIIPEIEAASGKRAGEGFAVCVNPEFTREGCAVRDFLHPSMTVLGAENPAHLSLLRDLYAPFGGQVFETSLRAAEMVKFACNAFHALKVDFANELGTLCGQLQVDAEEVTRIFTADKQLNLSAAYLTPGFAFGGSCLPKDVRALSGCASRFDLDLPLLRAILPSNRAHLERFCEAILASKRKRIGVLGLSFKTGTDDLRESPFVQLIKRLLGEGCQVRVWDREVSLGRLAGSNREFIEQEIPHIGALLLPDLESVVRTSDLIVLGTKAIDEAAFRSLLARDQIVIDLRSPQVFAALNSSLEPEVRPEPRFSPVAAGLAASAA